MPTPTRYALSDKIPTQWSPRTAQIIERQFERIFKATQLASTVPSGITDLDPDKGDLIYSPTDGDFGILAFVDTVQRVLTNDGGVPAWALVDLAAGVTNTLAPGNGGMGLNTYAQGDLVYATGVSTLARLAKSTTATRYLSNTGASNAPAWAQVDLSNGVTGTLGATQGGTGQIVYTTGDLLFANATTTLGKKSLPGTTGNYLRTFSASTFNWSTLILPDTIPGGVNGIGSVLISTAVNTVGALTSVATGKVLYSQGVGVAPVWSTMTYPNGASQGQIIYASASNVLSMLATGTADQVLTTQGAGANPQWKSVSTLTPTAVTAGSTLTDNAVVRGDGGSRGVQTSGVLIDDSNHVSGMATLTLPNTGLHLFDTGGDHDLIVAPGEDLSADRTLTVVMGDESLTVNFGDYTSVAHGSLTFTANGGGTWTVDSADLIYFKYAVRGKWVHIKVSIIASSLSGGTSTELSIAGHGLDFGPEDTFGGVGINSDDSFATQQVGQFVSRASGDTIGCKRFNGGAFANGTNTLSVVFAILASLD